MRPILRRLHVGLAWLFVAAIVVQVLLAGLALAELGGHYQEFWILEEDRARG